MSDLYKVVVTPEPGDGGIEINAETYGTVGGKGCDISCNYLDRNAKVMRFMGKKTFATVYMQKDTCNITTDHNGCVRVNRVCVKNDNRGYTLHNLTEGQNATMVISHTNRTFNFGLTFEKDYDPIVARAPPPKVVLPISVSAAEPARAAPAHLAPPLPRTPARVPSVNKVDPYEAWKAAPSGGAATPQMVYKRTDDGTWKFRLINELTLGRNEFPDEDNGNFLFSRVAVTIVDDSCSQVVFPGRNGYAINCRPVSGQSETEYDIDSLTQISLLSAAVSYDLFIGTGPPPARMARQETQAYEVDEEQTLAFDYMSESRGVARQRLELGHARSPRVLPGSVRRAGASSMQREPFEPVRQAGVPVRRESQSEAPAPPSSAPVRSGEGEEELSPRSIDSSDEERTRGNAQVF